MFAKAKYDHQPEACGRSCQTSFGGNYQGAAPLSWAGQMVPLLWGDLLLPPHLANLWNPTPKQPVAASSRLASTQQKLPGESEAQHSHSPASASGVLSTAEKARERQVFSQNLKTHAVQRLTYYSVTKKGLANFEHSGKRWYTCLRKAV